MKTESLNRVIKFFAKSILSSIKLERPAILMIKLFKKAYWVKIKRILLNKIDDLLIKFEEIKI